MTQTAVEVRVPTQVARHIRGIQPYLEQLLDEPKRFAVTLMSAGRRSPAIFDCTPESIVGAALVCAQLDLEPGPADHIYLIPRRNKQVAGRPLELTTLLGYKGMKALAERHPGIDYVETGVIHENDRYEHVEQPASLTHTPGWPDRGAPMLWYAIAHRGDGQKHVQVIDQEEVERRRSFSASPTRGPWVDNYQRMALKSAIRALWPELPSSLDLTRAAKFDDAAGAITTGDFVPELATPDARDARGAQDASDGAGGSDTDGDDGTPERETITVRGQLVDRETGEVIDQADIPDEQEDEADGAGAPDAAGEEGPGAPATDRQMIAIANLQSQRHLDDHDLCQLILDKFGVEATTVEEAIAGLDTDQAGDLIVHLQGDSGEEPPP